MGRSPARLMRIAELVHRDASGRELLALKDVFNVVHSSGEEFVLKVLFAGEATPANYYMGLDSRETPSAADDIYDLEGEPEGSGYERQAVASDDFDVELSSGSWRAAGPVVTFRAIGDSWGPVRNIFLCTGLGQSSVRLISTAPLGHELVVADGDTVTMRMAMSLSGC